MRYLITLLFVFFVGCANTAMVEDAEREAEYRKSLEKCCETYKSEGTGPIEMPQEWIDQWPEVDRKIEK